MHWACSLEDKGSKVRAMRIEKPPLGRKDAVLDAFSQQARGLEKKGRNSSCSTSSLDCCSKGSLFFDLPNENDDLASPEEEEPLPPLLPALDLN